jgi:predicted RNase H-like nuclease (RuvC/YqgF family)
VSVSELTQEIESAKDEIIEWRRNYEHLNKELDNLYYEMTEALNNKDQEIYMLQADNNELKRYIANLENKQRKS